MIIRPITHIVGKRVTDARVERPHGSAQFQGLFYQILIECSIPFFVH